MHGDGRELSPAPSSRAHSDTQLTGKPRFHGHGRTARSRGWAWPHDCEGLAQSRAPRGSPPASAPHCAGGGGEP